MKRFLQGEKEEMNNADMSDEQLAELVLDAGVSIDGSWNQRGWSARDGVVAVISIGTGKVLDVAFLSNACTACEQMKRKQQEGPISRMEYLGWVVRHEKNCYHNHEGSSQVICLLLLLIGTLSSKLSSIQLYTTESLMAKHSVQNNDILL